MVTSDRRLWHTRKSSLRLPCHDEADPRWIQIAGADPAMMADAARSNEGRGAQIIDINMGCPAKKVCNKAAGSALMRNEKLVADILSAVVDAVTVPVTLKIRLGWSPQERNAISIARLAEDAGVQLLTVHGRTRACKFAGDVDYDAIAEVVGAVSIPVIANGDIDSVAKAKSVFQTTGASGIMIGRAIQSRPWLVKQIDDFLVHGHELPDPAPEQVEMSLVDHLVDLNDFYGETMGVRIARKHVGWNTFMDRPFCRSFNRLESLAEQIDAIHERFQTMGAQAA
jgi:tRNA-dihydrouridine synthase B